MISQNYKTVDDEIFDCINLDSPKSFFLFAGAGSGKTRSLVNVLKRFRDTYIERLKRNGQRVAIITYTNAASDEIKRRLDFDSAFLVSTIHSFAWDLIGSFNSDIRDYLRETLINDITELQEKQAKSKSKTTKTYIEREYKIEAKRKRLGSLDSIKKFTYNPSGDNFGKDSLNHSEVIEIAAHFILTEPLMQEIVVRKFPVLLIDESQDTKKELIDALFDVQKNHFDVFSLGMFGDTMQRIYLDGKENLGQDLPQNWAKPKKSENYRCPERVVTLINRIRKDSDGQEQVCKKSMKGTVRLFISSANLSNDRLKVENYASGKMISVSNDEKWHPALNEVKILTLEHHMASVRGGFSQFFAPLYEIERFRTGLLDGSLSFVTLFSKQVAPLVSALKKGDEFSVAKIVKKYSPLINSKVLEKSENQIKEIENAYAKVQELFQLWENDNPSLNDILKKIYKNKIFDIPEILIPLAQRLVDSADKPKDEIDNDRILEAIEKAFHSKFSDFMFYVDYVSDNSRFGTHQGVKGLEFPRVMVVLDDEDARGFLFSYEKLFGAKELSENDNNNLLEGKETTVDRTRRLFYVTCSRAEQSLAIVIFSNSPEKVRAHAISQNWFAEEEIEMV